MLPALVSGARYALPLAPNWRVVLLWCLLVTMSAAGYAADKQYAGQKKDYFLLPNGWKLTPAGEQLKLNDLPLNIYPLADSRRALIATSGYNPHELLLVDLDTKQRLATATVQQSWYGLAMDPGGQRLFWSGGGANMIHEFRLDGSRLKQITPLDPPRSKGRAPQAKHFYSGLAFDPARRLLYSLDITAGELSAVDVDHKKPRRKVILGGRPYDVLLARDGRRLYVSDWARRLVLVVDPEQLTVVARIGVGEHPNQIVQHPRDSRIFVTCASSNSATVIDSDRGIVTETIATALFPRAPEGSTPDALAVSPDGQTLYVANADNNCVAVVDISQANQSQVQGFIPTGWYPTSLAITPDGKRLLIGAGLGNQTAPNPVLPPATAADQARPRTKLPFTYVGSTLSGALAIVPVPDEKQLAEYTDAVYRNCPYSDKLLTSAAASEKTAIPLKLGDPSPIKHVIYIIKENRTYDQVLGDLKQGNGDPSLVLFGRDVTPNHHKLAEEFVLLDNLYCNGHVSADGHPWSTMAYNTDYAAKNWSLMYSGRASIDDDEHGDLTNAPSGYIWDACGRLGLTYRSYGEYGRPVSVADGTFRMEGSVPGLVGHTCPNYFGVSFGLKELHGKFWRETDNAEVFLAEFRKFEEQGNLPRFIVMSMGEDHTGGTSPNGFTPQACVASNDLALGRLVEAISRSKYWPEIAIYVIEDDAQNGPDHVDAHRTVGFVISPYARRKVVDSSQYSTVSMLRTIELILGIPPLSQYDAAARPMFASFTDKPDLTPYTHEKARIDVNARNPKDAYGAARSAKMDFSEFDKINDFELNEVLWRAIKGKDAAVPPPVRRAIASRP